MNIKTRLVKLESTMVTFYKNPLYRALDRYAGKYSFDKIMLLDTIAALLVKDDPDHPKCGFAKAFLDWAASTNFKLIERAERIYLDLVAVKYLDKAPAPWTATAVDPNTVQPPYASYCTAEQLDKCPKHPFWR